jgi:hypothetical protein
MGYEAQQYDGPEDPNRPDNLWHPVAGDHGAHGNFDSRARGRSYEFWAESHTKLLGGILAGIGIAAGATIFNRKREEKKNEEPLWRRSRTA